MSLIKGEKIMGNSTCATLPSSNAAADFIQGKPGALGHVVLSTGLRAVLISLGIYAAGERDTKRLAKYSVGAAVAIEAFVLWWVWKNIKDESAGGPSAFEWEREEDE